MATDSVRTVQPGPARSLLSPGRRLLVALLALLVLLVGAAGGAWYLQIQDNARRVAPTVQVAGLPVAGLTQVEAQAAIERHFAELPNSQITLRGGPGTPWTFNARDLGISLDAAATAQAAKQAGRDLSNPAAVPLVLRHDQATGEAALQGIAADAAVPAQDAGFTADADGIRVTAAQAGHKLDVAATWQAIVAATQSYPFGEVTVKYTGVPPRVADSQIAGALATVHRLTDNPLMLTGVAPDGSPRSWAIDPATLRTWLLVAAGPDGVPVVANKLDEAHLRAYLQGLAPDLHRAAQDATLTLPDYATVATLTPNVAGQDLDVDASLAAAQAAAAHDGSARVAALVFKSLPATTTVATLQPLKTQLDTTMRDGLALAYNGQVHQIKGARLALILYVAPAPDGAVPYQIVVDDGGLSHVVAEVAAAIDQPAQNATYRLVNNQTTLVQPPQDGQQVDRTQAAAAIKDALLTGKTGVPLTVNPVKPQFGAADQASSIATPDLLSSDGTYYGSSSPERNWNVTLGASKLDGWLVPPGGIFSLDNALGPLTLDAGFKMGWAILVESGSATTIPAEAGGICQVATTLFHPLFWAGLPFVERHHHSYWISLYGQPPHGMQGLDATISPPDADLQFKNTTGNWLLIRARGDHQNVRVELWGTNPHWRVQADQPVITNVVHTDQNVRHETSDKLAAGRQVTVEHAQDGFTADIHRQVFDASGTKIDDWHAQGTYLPAYNTVVTGTGPKTSN